MKRNLAKQTNKQIIKLGGKETINSGATSQNNDFEIKFVKPICWGTWSRVSGESKFTNKNSISIKLETLLRTRLEARGNLPVLHIGFVGKNKTYDYVVINSEDFKSLLEWMKELLMVIDEAKK